MPEITYRARLLLSAENAQDAEEIVAKLITVARREGLPVIGIDDVSALI